MKTRNIKDIKNDKIEKILTDHVYVTLSVCELGRLTDVALGNSVRTHIFVHWNRQGNLGPKCHYWKVGDKSRIFKT